MKPLLRAAVRGFVVSALAALAGTDRLHAGDATWSPSAASRSWSDPANWSAGGPPDGVGDVATLGPSVTTAIVVDGNTRLERLVYAADAAPYTLSINAWLSFPGALTALGVRNDSGFTQQIVVKGYDPTFLRYGSLSFDGFVGNAGTNMHYTAEASDDGDGGYLSFTGSATMAANTYTVAGSSTRAEPGRIFVGALALAGDATIENGGGQGRESGGGRTAFSSHASALRSTIRNFGGAVTGARGGETSFSMSTTAANARIRNRGSEADAQGGQLVFEDEATAGRAEIINRSGQVAAVSQGGATTFKDRATAADAVITNNGGSVAGLFGQRTGAGETIFTEDSTAGSAVIENEGASAALAQGGRTDFRDRATSGAATINSYAQTAGRVEAGGGEVRFFALSTAAAGSFFNVFGSAIEGAGYSGRVTFFDSATAHAAFAITGGFADGAQGGRVEFSGFSSAGATSTFEVQGSASGGGGGDLRFGQSSRAGGVISLRGGTPGGGGGLSFWDGSSAGSARIDGEAGSSVSFFGSSDAATADLRAGRGGVTFVDDASAGSATITLVGGSSAERVGGALSFLGSSRAEAARISIGGGADFGVEGALLELGDTATASRASIENLGSVMVGGTGGRVVFGGHASAGAATVTNMAAAAPDAAGGVIAFRHSSSAASAAFVNNASSTTFPGARIEFRDSSTAADATFENVGGGPDSFVGGEKYGGGDIWFRETAVAGDATFTNRGSVVAGGRGGRVWFRDSSSAGGATITNGAGGFLAGGGGETLFTDTASAGASTLEAEGGFMGSRGGRIEFRGRSTGGTAQVTVNGNGSLDIENHAGGGITLGGLFGNGQVWVGLNTLTVDLGAFTGTIHNHGGQDSGVPPALVKTGQGTLSLGGHNDHARGTRIEGGTLVAAHEHALGTGSVTIVGGELLVEEGIAIANTIVLDGGQFRQVLGQGQAFAAAFPEVRSAAGPRQTFARILDGTASATAALHGTFAGVSPAVNDAGRSSDVFDLGGIPILDPATGRTDMFVLELVLAGSLRGDPSLAWLDPSTNAWVNAVAGNFGGGMTFVGDRPYDPATDFVLGTYGIDTGGGTAWAVLNHTSSFAIVPEPTAPASLLAGAATAAVLAAMRSCRPQRPR